MIVCPCHQNRVIFHHDKFFITKATQWLYRAFPNFYTYHCAAELRALMEFTRTLKVCSWGLLEALYDYLSVGASAMKIADKRKQVVMHISQPVATKQLRLCSNTSHRGYTLPSKSGSHDLPHVINTEWLSPLIIFSPRGNLTIVHILPQFPGQSLSRWTTHSHVIWRGWCSWVYSSICYDNIYVESSATIIADDRKQVLMQRSNKYIIVVLSRKLHYFLHWILCHPAGDHIWPKFLATVLTYDEVSNGLAHKTCITSGELR